MRLFVALAASFTLATLALAQSHTATLPASPTTVVWGYYSAKAKPVLTVHSGHREDPDPLHLRPQ